MNTQKTKSIIHILGILFFVSISFSCSNTSAKNKSNDKKQDDKAYKYSSMKDDILHLDLNEASKHKKEVKLSDVCDSLIYISLETSKECLLSRLYDIKIDGKDLFILGESGFFHFNINGEFLGQIGRIGRGPGEFIGFTFSLDRLKKIIYAKAHYGGKILSFDYNGKLLSDSLSYKGNVHGMRYSQSLSSIYGSSEYCITRIFGDYNVIIGLNVSSNKKINIPSKLFPDIYFDSSSEEYSNYPASRIQTYKGEVFYQEIACDTVFKIAANGCIPSLVVNHNNSKQFKSSMLDGLSYKKQDDLFYKYYPNIRGESDRFIFLEGMSDDSFFFDKKEKSLICIDKSKDPKIAFFNDMDNVSHFSSLSVLNDKYLYKKINAIDLLEREDDQPINNRRIKKIIKGLTEESNPVLVLARIKM